MYPSHLRYTKEHEWLELSGDMGTLGITDFAQRELGDIVYVELPEVGKQVGAGDTLGTIESVKAVSEFYSPVAGTVLEVNTALSEKPETINSDPHGKGWICRLRLANPRDAEQLLDEAAYRQLVSA